MTVIPREFDWAGRHRRIDAEASLKDVTTRQENHVHRCVKCLRFETGRAPKRCAVGQQIQGQREVIERALLR